MANIQNLVPNEARTPEERRRNARKAGIASGRARRAKRERGEVLEQLLDLMITNPAMIKNLEKLGIDKKDHNWRYAIDAAQIIKASQGDTKAYQNIMNAIYGLPQQKIENTNIELKSILPKPKK